MILFACRAALVTALALALGSCERGPQARFAAPQPPGFAVFHNVPVVAQTKNMSCWAAAAAMMLSWRTQIATTERSAARTAGPNFEAIFLADTGLRGPEIGDLARALSLRVEAPQNFTAVGYSRLLQAHGPLWVGTAIFYGDRTYRHVRVVRGISGDGTEDGSRLAVIDPAGGRTYEVTVSRFAREMETIAQQDLGQGRELTPQIIRYP
jgi:hypothetical protein